jgi:uncharacterized protein
LLNRSFEFNRENPGRVKPLLYVYRVLLTGIYLMQTGAIEANLTKINEHFKLKYINDLIEYKRAGAEKSFLKDAEMPFYEKEYERLRSLLEESYQASTLPEVPSAKPALNDLLVQIRLATVAKSHA